MEIENGYIYMNIIKQKRIIIPYSVIKINTNSTPKYPIIIQLLNPRINSD